MLLEKFFDSKFLEISKFISKNQNYIDNNPKFRKSIDDRVLQWVTLASIAFGNEDISIGEFQGEMKLLGFDGMITFYNDTSGKKFNVVNEPDDVSKAFESTGVPTVSAEALMSLKELIDLFDAKIINVEGVS